MSKFPANNLSRLAFPKEINVKIIGGDTIVVKFDDKGVEQRKQKRAYVTRDVTLKYKEILKSDIRKIWQYQIDRGGSFEAFSLFLDTDLAEYMTTDIYEDEYVGSGDSAVTMFELPSKGATSYALKVNGTLKTESTHYNFTGEVGGDGEDRINFVSPPTSGEVITWDFTGFLKIRCRFQDDEMEFDDMFNLIMSSELKFRGLLNSE